MPDKSHPQSVGHKCPDLRLNRFQAALLRYLRSSYPQSQTKTQRQPEKGKPHFQAAYLVLPTVSQHHPITPRAEYPM